MEATSERRCGRRKRDQINEKEQIEEINKGTHSEALLTRGYIYIGRNNRKKIIINEMRSEMRF